MLPTTEQRVAQQRVRLNPQGLARKDKPLMSAIQPDAGQVFVSSDLSSGEPTVISHYSRDVNYMDACLNLVGKEPFYDGNVLRIGNIYAMVASVAPTGKARMRELFNTTFNGVPFPEAYVSCPDLVKDSDPKFYALHKILTLGLGYAMGPRKLVTTAYDAGHLLDFPTAKAFYREYWTLFSGVRRFADKCAAALKVKGYLVNQFGYKLHPDAPHKAMNYYVQSSVSGVMHVLAMDFFALAPYCTLLLVIHDELVFSCPQERVEEARAAMQAAEDKLNERLGWTVKVRAGFKPGDSMYAAK